VLRVPSSMLDWLAWLRCRLAAAVWYRVGNGDGEARTRIALSRGGKGRVLVGRGGGLRLRVVMTGRSNLSTAELRARVVQLRHTLLFKGRIPLHYLTSSGRRCRPGYRLPTKRLRIRIPTRLTPRTRAAYTSSRRVYIARL